MIQDNVVANRFTLGGVRGAAKSESRYSFKREPSIEKDIEKMVQLGTEKQRQLQNYKDLFKTAVTESP